MKKPSSTTRVATCNLEHDGGGGRSGRWEGCHRRLAEMEPDMLFRQEMKFSEQDDFALLKAAQDVLGMRGWMGTPPAGTTGPTIYTGVFIREPVFTFEKQHVATALWHLPPTNIQVRMGDGAPIAVCSFHAAYMSPPRRLDEAYWLTTLVDKAGYWAVMAGDCNAYPRPGAPGETPLPTPEEISDKVHVAHRFIRTPDGRLVADTQLDDIMHTVEQIDVARVVAERGKKEAIQRIGEKPRKDQGPMRRIDRIYAPKEWDEALVDAGYVENPDSDHPIVYADFDRAKLTEIVSQPPERHAERLAWAAAAKARE